MLVNCHAHVFNVLSVFTVKTMAIFLNRLRLDGLPVALVEQVQDLLEKVFREAGKVSDPEELFRDWLRKLGKSDNLKADWGKLPAGARLQLELLSSEDVNALGSAALARVLRKVREAAREKDEDARRSGLEDLIGFLAIGLLPSIKEVTAHLMDQLPKDAAAVALMMDITQDGTGDEDLFLRQLSATSAQVLAYPGRLFPFVAANPRRKDYLRFVERALTSQGFIGVKLYPSLGFNIDSELDKLFAFCAEHEVPILQHCSPGGFYATEKDIERSNPVHWESVLSKHKTLKVCFGHFGGDANLLAAEGWTGRILKLMDAHEGVYADVAYHTAAMRSLENEKAYFERLNGLLSHERLGSRVLFGTDYYMVRAVLREISFWEYFQSRLSPEHFRLASEHNPARFLGLPLKGQPARWAMRNYCDFVVANASRCSSAPAAWLAEEIKGRANFEDTGLGVRWTANNEAHFRVFQFLKRNQMTRSHTKQYPFRKAGSLRVRELLYWNREFEAPEIFSRKCQVLAENLDKELKDNGAKYEPGFTQKKAEDGLKSAFREGSTAFWELGELCDRMYRFRSEK